MKYALLAAVAGTLLLGACGTDNSVKSSRTEASVAQRPSLSITAPSRDLLAGDTATFMANTVNTYGRDAKVRWTVTGGRLTTEENGRIARVRFDDTGTYTVKAMLDIDGNPVQTEAVDVRVRPVK
ncbi:MAG: hypothetical protein K2Q09_06795 [Phycisphaerales bacterium]|nr:hypothetical protein [Phycisphaerales bacterium]